MDARLADFDRKLRQIQAELAPERAAAEAELVAAAREPEPPPRPPEPEPPSPPPEPEPPPPPPEPEPEPQRPSEPEHPHRGRSGPLAELLAHAPPTPPPPEDQPSSPDSDLKELRHLLSALHSVLDGIDALLTRRGAAPQARDRRAHEVTIAAGPFESIDDVRRFERELAAVPGVRDVTVRGYEGAAKAILDVHLGGDH